MSIVPPVVGYAETYSKPAFPTWVRAMIVIVSILKALPLVVFGLIAMALSGTITSYDDELGSEFGAGMAIIAVPLLLLLGLLLMQTIGALAGRPTAFFVSAVIVSLVDVLIVAASLFSLVSSESPSGGEVLVLGVAGLQWAALIGGFMNKPR